MIKKCLKRVLQCMDHIMVLKVTSNVNSISLVGVDMI